MSPMTRNNDYLPAMALSDGSQGTNRARQWRAPNQR